MPAYRQSRPRLFAFLAALCFLPGLSVILSLSWLKQQPDELVYLLSGLAATVTIVASLILSVLHDRRMGEWERTNSRFSAFWGDAAGTSLIGLLMAIPAGREVIVSTIGNVAGVTDPDFKLVMMAFVGGFMAVVLARVVCMAIISIGWTFWKSRGAVDPA